MFMCQVLSLGIYCHHDLFMYIVGMKAGARDLTGLAHAHVPRLGLVCMGFAIRSRDEIAFVGFLKPMKSSLVCGGPKAASRAMGGSGLGRDGGKTAPPKLSRPERTSSGWVRWGKAFLCVYSTDIDLRRDSTRAWGGGRV